MVCRLYRALCSKYGPEGMTISAWAFKHSRETGNVWLRNRIDGFVLFFAGEQQHCHNSFQRHRASTLTHEGTRQ